MPGNFPPPSGSEANGHAAPGGHRCLELCPICRTADVLRSGAAPDLRGQLDEVSREALLTMRSLIDHYLDRIDAEPARERVQQIPID